MDAYQIQLANDLDEMKTQWTKQIATRSGKIIEITRGDLSSDTYYIDNRAYGFMALFDYMSAN